MNINDTPSVTITDVARAAGVSVGTVSRVLNGFTNITQTNFDRVQQAIKELGYEKCRSAEQLVSRRNGSRVRTGNIGMVFTEMGSDWASHPMVAAYSMGVERACEEKGFHALIEFSDGRGGLPRCIRENKVDGLLVKTTRELPAMLEARPKDLPIACMGLNNPTVQVQQVAPDNRGAGWQVTHYLWDMGHRRIGFVCADMLHPMFVARFQGYEEFLRNKRAFDPAICFLREREQVPVHPESRPPDMSDAVGQLLAAPGAPVTAVIAANDWEAGGLYPALKKAGRQIPADISVVGFDNSVQVCAGLSPQLTSFAIPFVDVAYAAALKVIERIQTPNQLWSHSLHLVRGDIVERASVRLLQTP